MKRLDAGIPHDLHDGEQVRGRFAALRDVRRAYLPHTIFVAERGLEHFDLSMRAQYELTKRFSAESSIRAYIAKDPGTNVHRFAQMDD